MYRKAAKIWTDPYEMIAVLDQYGPMRESGLAQQLKITKQLVSYHVKKGVNTQKLKRLGDGRVATVNYDEVEEKIRPVVLRESKRPFFWEDAYGSDYDLHRAAVELGLPPAEIEAAWYRVLNRLRSDLKNVKLTSTLTTRPGVSLEESPILCPNCQGKRIRVRKDSEIAEYCRKCDKWQGNSLAMDKSLIKKIPLLTT